MNKDEMMIEDMARIICKGTSNEGFCEKCDFKKHEQFGYTYQCRKFDDAEALYNAGYRKIGDDEIVIKKREYDTLLKTYTQIYDNAYHWGLKVGEEKTAMDILQELKDRQTFMLADEVFGRENVITRKINELAEKYGVELEDKDNDDK